MNEIVISDSDSENSFSFIVAEEQKGERLDRFLSEQLADHSRSRVKSLIKEGFVSSEEKVVDEPNTRIKPGESYTIILPAAEPAIPKPQDIPLNVVYEDAAIIVLNKPAGMVVHPAAGNWSGTLVNALLAHCGDSLSGIGGVKRPGIVHRLDKETSGLMVVAKTDIAHHSLSEQFAAHGKDGRMTRAYTAFVWGSLARPKGFVDADLGRKESNRLKMAVVKSGGKHAVTHYEIIKRYLDNDGIPAVSQIKCILETGRTHQIRVHMAHIGHPLLGDQAYGAGFAASKSRLSDRAQKCLESLSRQALHAFHLGFEHPISGEPMRFDSELPKKIQRLADALAAKQ